MRMKIVEHPKAHIVLFYPLLQEAQYPMWAPLEAYAIATAYLHAGFEVTIIDGRGDADPTGAMADPFGKLEEALEDAFMIGVSAMLGGQLKHAIEALAFAKSKRPDVITIVGGWFASLFTEATFESPDVDLVAVGPADASAPAAALRALAGESMAGLNGIWARENGELVRNEFAHLPPYKDVHPIPYELVGIQRYMHPGGWINTMTSRGCPGGCNFCAIFCLDPRRWTALSAAQVGEEWQALNDLGFRAFKVSDTDFLADVKRVEAISHEILRRGLKLRFEVLARHWNLRTMTDEQIVLLRKAGCTEIETGIESGSQRMVDFVRKQLDVGEVPNTVRRFVERGIRMKLNFMFGIPTETTEELVETLQLIARVVDDCKELGLGDDVVRLQLFRYTPVPGDPAQTDEWIEAQGAELNNLSLQEYMDFPVTEDLATGRMTWISAKHEKVVRSVYTTYAPLAFIPEAISPAKTRPHWHRLLKLFQVTARWRIKNGVFGFPFEQWLNDRYGMQLRYGGVIINDFDDVLPEPNMGQTINPHPPLKPQGATKSAAEPEHEKAV